jgi:uncharacterized protein YbjQ (UPF0145 family)
VHAAYDDPTDSREPDCERTTMLISTMNDVPGHRVTTVLGELAMRFDTSEMGGDWTEICAYATAVTLEPLG